jgi:hypothetical protein
MILGDGKKKRIFFVLVYEWWLGIVNITKMLHIAKMRNFCGWNLEFVMTLIQSKNYLGA